jgi:hypothetical protein
LAAERPVHLLLAVALPRLLHAISLMSGLPRLA